MIGGGTPSQRAADAPLGWLGFIRLGLVQAALGAVVIFATSTLSRVMVVEYAVPALLPGGLVGLHYAAQVLRPRWGFGSDVGTRRTRWIWGGMTLLATGNMAAAVATTMLHVGVVAALAVALLAYLMIGIGVGAAGTALLALLAQRVRPQHRTPAATIVWMMMIAGFIATAAFVGTMLDPFTSARLVSVAAMISGTALLVTLAVTYGIEPRGGASRPAVALPRETQRFRAALRDVWSDPAARRLTIFIFVSMLAYSGQELILEPYAGLVFGLTPGASARLAGLQHAGLLVGMILVAVAGYRFAGRALGAPRTWIIGGCVVSAAAAAAIAATGVLGSQTGLRGGVFVLGAANGAFSIAAIGAMMQLAAVGRSGLEGTRMGLWGAAQALAFALGGVTASGASDVARHVLGAPVSAYALVFLGEAIVFAAAACVAAAVFPHGRRADAGRAVLLASVAE